jgi:hypothetical protein
MTMESDDIDPHISLKAITGISPVTTMRLSVRINADNTTTLVDSDSTHSFIFEATVCLL